MPTPIDFVNVSTAGLESSPHAEALAGLRANEARYFKNKYDVEFSTMPAREAPELVVEPLSSEGTSRYAQLAAQVMSEPGVYRKHFRVKRPR